MDEANNSLVIEDAANPQTVSFAPDAKEPPKAPTAREAIERSLADMEAKDGKRLPDEARDPKPEPVKENQKADEAAKAEQAPKAEETPVKDRAPDGKFAAKAAEPQAGDDGSQQPSNTERSIDRAPDRFLPRAKEEWVNTPESVRGEVHRAMENFDKGLTEYKESHEFRKTLKPFEEAARQANTTLPDALRNYMELDALVTNDPVNGVTRILQRQGIDVVQFAQHILNTAQAYQDNPALAQTSQLQQQVNQLTGQLQQMTRQQLQAQEQAQRQAGIQEIENGLFNEVRKEHPRFDELRQDVAFFFNSDKLSSIADERSRLYAAVDMAERINPAPSSQNTRDAQRPINSAGGRSIRGTVSADGKGRSGKGATLTAREAIEAAMEQFG